MASHDRDPYVPKLPERAHAYHAASRVLFLFGIVWRILGLVLFLRSGAASRCRDIAEAVALRLRRGRLSSPLRPGILPGPSFVVVACFYVLFSAAMALWALPVSAAELAVEHRFGFSNETVAQFARDELLSQCIGWAIIPIVWLAYRVYARMPSTWWLAIWAVMAPITLFVSLIYPVTVAPMYNRYTPLEPGRLRQEILSLAARAGIRQAGVFVEDTSRRTTHVNAYVAGIGPSARIVINDTALKQLPEDQILAMVGHEIGHYAERHVIILTAANIVGTGLLLGLLALLVPRLTARWGPACGLRGPGDVAGLPLVTLTILFLSLLGEPVDAALSRELEHRADAYGLQLTGLNDATARLMVGFAERDLSDPNPPRLLHLWFGTHPTLLERIDFARHFPRSVRPIVWPP